MIKISTNNFHVKNLNVVNVTSAKAANTITHILRTMTKIKMTLSWI